MNYLNLKIRTITIIFFISSCAYAQTNNNFNKEYICKKYNTQIKSVNNTDFLVYKSDSLPKPTIVFITGSNFTPFFVNGECYAFPFNIYKHKKKFNFVIVNKPGIPMFDDSLRNAYLNESFNGSNYLDSTGHIPDKFIKNNNCDYYVKTHNDVINYLIKQTWVDKEHIFVLAHSQGTRIASSLALVNKNIKKVVLSSPGSVNNRFFESIRKIRYDESFELFNNEQAQHKIDSIHQRYSDLILHKTDNEKLFDGGTYYSYASFTFPTTKQKLFQIKQPVLVIYGTNSNQDLDCDYLNLVLMERDKKNVTVKPYVGYDHNFFKDVYNDKGEVINRTFNWDSVMTETFNWLIK